MGGRSAPWEGRGTVSGVGLLKLVSLRPWEGGAGNLIIYRDLRGHHPYPPRTLPPTRFHPCIPGSRCLLRLLRLLHVLRPDPRAVRSCRNRPSSRSPASRASPPASPAAARAGFPEGRRVPGGSGADPHRRRLLRLADQARARSPKEARATRRAGGAGRRRVRPTWSGGGRGRARVPAGGAHGQPGRAAGNCRRHRVAGRAGLRGAGLRGGLLRGLLGVLQGHAPASADSGPGEGRDW